MVKLRLEERRVELNKALKTFDLDITPRYMDISYGAWIRYNENGMLPYSGTWLDQPAWLIDDFQYFDILSELESIPFKLQEATRYITQIASRGRS